MRPGEFQDRFVLFRVIGVSGRVGRRRYAPEQVRREHGHDLGVDGLCDHVALGRDVFEHLVQGGGLDLLGRELGGYVVEVEDDGTLMKLLEEERVSFVRAYVCTYMKSDQTVLEESTIAALRARTHEPG